MGGTTSKVGSRIAAGVVRGVTSHSGVMVMVMVDAVAVVARLAEVDGRSRGRWGGPDLLRRSGVHVRFRARPPWASSPVLPAGQVPWDGRPSPAPDRRPRGRCRRDVERSDPGSTATTSPSGSSTATGTSGPAHKCSSGRRPRDRRSTPRGCNCTRRQRLTRWTGSVGYVRSSNTPSAWRANRPTSRGCTGSSVGHGQPPKPVV